MNSTTTDTPLHPDRQQEASALCAQGRFADAFEMLAPLVGSPADEDEDDAARVDALNVAALAAMGSGKTDVAHALWQRCIAARPAFEEAYHGLAAMLTALGQLAAAEAVWRRLLDVNPVHADAHGNLGVVLHRLGRHLEAEDAYRTALARQPAHLDAHYNLGILLHELGRHDEAEAAYRAALALNPNFARAHNNLGNVLRERGRTEEAEEAYRQALLAEPHYPEALNNYGALLKAQRRYIEAELSCRLAIQIRPDYVEALNNLGCVLTDLQRYAEAEQFYRKAIMLRPDHAEAHYNLGVALQRLERYPEAETSYRVALRLSPGRAEIFNNLGSVLCALDRIDEAHETFAQALAQNGDLALAHFNMGSVLKEQGALDASVAAYRRALELDPDYGDALFRLATLLITMGRYEEGWQLYERRYENNGFVHYASRRMLSCPHWQGEPIAGKSLLLWQEDGLGDMIQFSRYARLLKAQGAAHVAFGGVEALHCILAGVEGIDTLLTHAEATARAQEFDYWASPLSLPLRMGTTLETTPEPTRFNVDPARIEYWGTRLAALGAGPRVGLVWRGNPKHHNDFNRSIPSLAALAPLWSVPGLKFVSLQKGAGEDEARAAQKAGSDQPLLHLGSDVADFVDTAAILSQLDLLICVDTSTAHLAASLGKPCWVMLPRRDVDWRWLETREDSPWYPGNVRIFRQTGKDTWSTAIERVRQACEERFGAAS
ncbi:Tfp pilus assembly protein PilF [Paraburkholderia bannensis]|uniref:Tfp pilus assembly protein PilF n=1 Tax=Paraburkholderia bannensis TaxID=765414 RepID=A0A7W9WSR3_9BURK|nr:MULTISPECIES: tetratricopeptide repeat protein [Paraburkholderia]MBB3257569.1 Tfp pilus assembly protein PilF [Paraburkholderia sp. WP4_3_2]MBB6102582.1 Tfp pilus assembly protein PilF [Paraburkholderia bannensis]